MNLKPFEIEDLIRIESRSYIESGYPITPEILKLDIGISQTVLCNKEVLACGGIIKIGNSHIGTAWIYVSRHLSMRHLRYFLLCSQLAIARAHREKKIRRIQASVFEDDEKSIKFIEYLGFKKEGRMLEFGPEGQAAYLYAHYQS